MGSTATTIDNRAVDRRLTLRLVGVALGGVLLFTLSLSALGAWLGFTGAAGPIGPDLAILHWAGSIRVTAVAAGFTVVTVLGSAIPATLIGMVALTALYWNYRQPQILLLLPVVILGAMAISELTKDIVHRQRPPVADALPPYAVDPAFPSGHTISSVVMAGSVAYVIVWLSPRLGARIAACCLALLWAAGVSFSRLYLGQHWFSDVAFGWVTGLLWLALICLTHHRLTRGEPRTSFRRGRARRLGAD